jgi:uncharacterized protein YlxW (UPF0749 family)
MKMDMVTIFSRKNHEIPNCSDKNQREGVRGVLKIYFLKAMTLHSNQIKSINQSMKNSNQIRKELAILINEKKKSCKNEKEINQSVNDARKEINLKYGKGWRDRRSYQSYDDWWNGKNLDGSFAYNGVTDDF